MTIGIWGAWNVSRGRTGRALLIIRESEIAAGALGIPAARYKVHRLCSQCLLCGGCRWAVRLSRPHTSTPRISASSLVHRLPQHGRDRWARHHRWVDHGADCFYVIVPELLRGIKDAPGLGVRPAARHRHGAVMPRGLWGTGPSPRAENMRWRASRSKMSRLISVAFRRFADVTFEFESGAIVGLIGPNGAEQEHAPELHLRHHAADARSRCGSMKRFSRRCRRQASPAAASAAYSSIRSWSLDSLGRGELHDRLPSVPGLQPRRASF